MLDLAAEWPERLAIAAMGSRVRHADDPTRSVSDLAPPSVAAAVALLDRTPNPIGVDRGTYVRVMLAAKGCIDGLGGDGTEDIAEAVIGWACRWPDSPGEDVERERWERDFSTRDALLAGWPHLLAVAARLGVDVSAERAAGVTEFDAVVDPAPAAVPARLRMRDRLLRPADCETGERRGYIVKHLIAPGDVGAVIGAPGSGKSHLAPFIGYAVAQGRAVFSMRTKPGSVLYLAAEDFTGMRQRVHALKLRHGDAPGFALASCGNLTDEAARVDLLDAVAFLRPVLVIVDTVGAAWAGIDENDSAGMGAVVATARRIAATGAAVILVHHTAKNGDGTPRGHSILNGTLDMCVSLEPMDKDRIVRGKLTKNRNGSCDRDIAFRSAGQVLGTDEDDDEITAPVAIELCGSAVPAAKPRLSEQHARALDILQSLVTGSGGVPEADWRTACEDRRLSASPDPHNRAKVATKVLQRLIETQYVTVSDDRLHITKSVS